MRSIFIPHLGKIGLAYFSPSECEVAHTSRALIRRVEPARAGGLAHDAADFEHRERGSQDRDRRPGVFAAIRLTLSSNLTGDCATCSGCAGADYQQRRTDWDVLEQHPVIMRVCSPGAS